jgi:hypothetical protein
MIGTRMDGGRSEESREGRKKKEGREEECGIGGPAVKQLNRSHILESCPFSVPWLWPLAGPPRPSAAGTRHRSVGPGRVLPRISATSVVCFVAGTPRGHQTVSGPLALQKRLRAVDEPVRPPTFGWLGGCIDCAYGRGRTMPPEAWAPHHHPIQIKY